MMQSISFDASPNEHCEPYSANFLLSDGRLFRQDREGDWMQVAEAEESPEAS